MVHDRRPTYKHTTTIPYRTMVPTTHYYFFFCRTREGRFGDISKSAGNQHHSGKSGSARPRREIIKKKWWAPHCCLGLPGCSSPHYSSRPCVDPAKTTLQYHSIVHEQRLAQGNHPRASKQFGDARRRAPLWQRRTSRRSRRSGTWTSSQKERCSSLFANGTRHA